MAGTYSTNLTTMNTAENSTGWAEPTATGWTGLSTVTSGDTDDYIQGTACNSALPKTSVGGLLYNNGSGITIPTDGAVLLWLKADFSGLLTSEATGGMRFMIGNATNAFYAFSHYGGDTYQYGGWINLAQGDPTQLLNSSLTNPTISQDFTAGTPTGTRQYFGWAYNITANANRGFPYKVDALRYGRCDLVATGGTNTSIDNANPLSSSAANFAQMANYNDYNDGGTPTFGAAFDGGRHRLGILQATGAGYLWKGLLQLGTSSTSVYFNAASQSITVDNTKKVTNNFNKIEIRNASSTVIWDTVSIAALNANARGILEVVDNATVTFSNCSFLDMGTFAFLSNSTITGSVFRRCNTITSGGASISGCSIINSNSSVSMAVTASTISSVDSNTFTRISNTNHAVSFPAPGGTTNLIWGNVLSGYVTGTAGNNVGTTSGTGNEAIYITGSTTSTINITVAVGATIPSIRKDSSNVTVNIAANQLTFTITNIKSGTELRAYTYTTASDPTTYTEFVGAEVISGSPVSSTFTTITYDATTDSYTTTKTFDGGTAIPLIIVAHNLEYQFFRTSITLSSSQDTSLQLFQISDRNYDEGDTPYV